MLITQRRGYNYIYIRLEYPLARLVRKHAGA